MTTESGNKNTLEPWKGGDPLKAVKEVLVQMLASKKAVAAIAGTIVGLAAKAGLQLDTEALAVIVAPILLYILGQGMADLGKEAVKQDAANKQATDSAV